jgi:diguanylate cyclase (GGDEF)-like protein
VSGGTARRGLPRAALPLLAAVLLPTAALDGLALTRLGEGRGHVAAFVALALGAAIAHLFVVVTGRNQSYHTSIAFLLPAALLLPWPLLVLVPIVQHVPEWVRERYPWYIQAFNIGNYTLDVLAAWVVFRAVHGDGGGLGGRFALAGLLAAIAFVVVNHGLLAAMLRVARGHGLRQTGLFTPAYLSTDLVLALLGLPVAALWHVSLWLVPAAVAPLVLIRRSLAVPVLEERVRVDPKTGLFNATHFAEELESELARSIRFGRPLAVVMGDLDLLRDINNSYGHLAGDAVLAGIADTIRSTVRSYDVPARFGGEEFVILLPETPAAEAFEIAERIRLALAARAISVETVTEPIRATISCGVAAYPADGDTTTALMHQADLAVYRAKAQGRNRVVAAASEAELVAAGHSHAIVTPSTSRGRARAGCASSGAGAQGRRSRRATPRWSGPTTCCASARRRRSRAWRRRSRRATRTPLGTGGGCRGSRSASGAS